MNKDIMNKPLLLAESVWNDFHLTITKKHAHKLALHTFVKSNTCSFCQILFHEMNNRQPKLDFSDIYFKIRALSFKSEGGGVNAKLR